MSITIDGVPETITRAQYLSLIEGVGLDVKRVRALEFRTDGIHAVVYAYNTDGHMMIEPLTNQVIKHTVYIRVVDAPTPPNVPTPPNLDDSITLDGDEDGGVGIVCRLCDTGGQPIAYLGYSNPYATVPDVEHTPTITALLDAATRHLSNRH